MTTELAKRDMLDIDIDFSDLLVIFMVIIMASLMSTMVTTSAQATQALQAQAYTGLTDSRDLNASHSLQWINLISKPPYTPWITASFHNNGPHSVFIAINNPDEATEIAPRGGIDVDMSGADRRIEFVFYRCSASETASVTVVGKY